MKEPSVGASHLDVLSESIMDETALNNLSELQQKTSEYGIVAFCYTITIK